jgi:hypothetical protein
MTTVLPVPLRDLAPLKELTSKIQDAKRAALAGKPSKWPDRMEEKFSKLEQASANPYVALDLEYLRDRQPRNRSFAYVITYETFLCPERDDSGGFRGTPVLASAVKLGDGGQQTGYGSGRASGSIISRVVRSYWEDGNKYNAVLQGAVIPGSDHGISSKIAKRLGGAELQIRGDVWREEVLDHLPVQELLELMKADGS